MATDRRKFTCLFAVDRCPQNQLGLYFSKPLLFKGWGRFDAGASPITFFVFLSMDRFAPSSEASAASSRQPSGQKNDLGRRTMRTLSNRWAVLFLFGAIALIVARAPGLLVHPRIWAEEGIYLTFALHHSAFQTLVHLHPDSGYYLLAANAPALLSAFVSKTFGLEYAPFVTTYSSLCLQILPLAILIFGKSHLFRNRAAIAAGCLLILLAPTTSGELWLNTINSMSWFGLAALVVLFEDTTAWSRRKTIAMRALFVIFGFCGPYAVIMFPLFVFSWFVYKEREKLMQAGILAAFTVVQFGIFLLVRQSGGATSRLGSLTLDSAIVNVFYFHIAGALGGERGAIAIFKKLGLIDALQKSIAVPRDGPVVLAACLCALLTGLIFWALWDKRLRSQSTLLIGMFLFFAAFTAGASAYGVPLNRYAFFPGLSFLLVFLDAGLNHKYLAARIICSLMLVCAVWSGIRQYRDFWTAYAAGAPEWADEVQKWKMNNRYQLRVWPPFFPPVVAWDERGHTNDK